MTMAGSRGEDVDTRLLVFVPAPSNGRANWNARGARSGFPPLRRFSTAADFDFSA
jgi:hypothetical protein